MALLDVPTNWRKWSHWQGGGKAEPYEGHPIVAIDPAMAVEIKDRFDVIEMRNWLHEHTRSKLQMWGRWDFVQHQYRIDRTLIGFVVLFEDEDEAFHFKMRWF